MKNGVRSYLLLILFLGLCSPAIYAEEISEQAPKMTHDQAVNPLDTPRNKDAQIVPYILEAKTNSIDIDELFQNNRILILSNPITILGDVVFGSGLFEVSPQFEDMAKDSEDMAKDFEDMAKQSAEMDAEGNLGLVKLYELPFDGTLLANRPKLQKILLQEVSKNSSCTFTLTGCKMVFQDISDGVARHVVAVMRNNIRFTDSNEVTASELIQSYLKPSPIRNDILAYELVPEAELPTYRAGIATGLKKNINGNFSRFFLGEQLDKVSENTANFTCKKLATNQFYSHHHGTSLDELMELTAQFSYDSEFCVKLACKFDEMEMTRWAALVRQRMKDYFENSNETTTP